jgi:hypothetical protein
VSSGTFVEHEFAGELRRFQLPAANPVRLYRGIEGEAIGNLAELAECAARQQIGRAHAEAIIAHALSRGHPLTLMRMRELVKAEMDSKPLAEFLSLAVSVVAASYAGPEEAP